MSNDYSWSDLHRWTRMLVLSVLLVGIGGILICLSAVDLALGVGKVGLGMLAISIPFYMLAWFRFALFACPRCGKRFFISWGSINPFAKKCRHCSLPKWAENDPDKSDH